LLAGIGDGAEGCLVPLNQTRKAGRNEHTSRGIDFG